MPPKSKRPRSPSPPVRVGADDGLAPHKDKKLKLLASHALSSPFPDHPHPTPAEAAQVHAVLASAHPTTAPARAAPLDANDSAGTCGRVPDVLESLVGTILSQNTTAQNSSAAKRGLDRAFGRNNFAAVARAPRRDVVDAIRTGGLANRKAGVIQKILREVEARHGVYSLQHLAQGGVGPDDRGKAKEAEAETEAGGDSKPVVSDEDAMRELVSYDGVGPKTASCVLLFCLGRASFPVDTHVFRLSRLLGWVPGKADRVTAQAHLDLTIPAELKYGLHVLMVAHGRRCLGCKGGGRGKGECVLKTWLEGNRGVEDEELEELAVKAEEDVKAEESSQIFT